MLILRSGLGFHIPGETLSRVVAEIGMFLVLQLWAVFRRVGLGRLRFWEYNMLHASTMKNGDPRTACSVEGRVGEVLPFPIDGAKMFRFRALR